MGLPPLPGLEGDEMTKSSASKNHSSVQATLDAKPLEALGRALRAHYDDLLQEPLPARFDELLSRLDAEDGAARNKEETDCE